MENIENNPYPDSSIPPRKTNKRLIILVCILLVVVVIAGWVFYANKINVKQTQTPLAPKITGIIYGAQKFSMLDSKQMPAGFLSDFPKNGLVGVSTSQQGNAGSNIVEGILRFLSSKSVQENYDFYKQYFTQAGWTMRSKNDSIFPNHIWSSATKGAMGADGSANIEIASFSNAATSTKSVVEITIFSNKQ